MRGISRAVSKKCKGWLVRVYTEGKVISKFFSDSVYGGKGEALVMAQKNLKILERQYPHQGMQPFYQRPMKSNKTGINGVSETFARWRNGEKIPCFSVYYRLGPQRCNKRFYIHHYESREHALKEAAAFRKEMEKVMLREWKRDNKLKVIQKAQAKRKKQRA